MLTYEIDGDLISFGVKHILEILTIVYVAETCEKLLWRSGYYTRRFHTCPTLAGLQCSAPLAASVPLL